MILKISTGEQVLKKYRSVSRLPRLSKCFQFSGDVVLGEVEVCDRLLCPLSRLSPGGGPWHQSSGT